MTNDTHLTERQIRVLKLRARGHIQAEIARQFGTSRANISAIEKKAMINIERSKNTLNLTKM
ncbi:MAG: Tfx family DNA-binding protein, partial [Candidatus Hydrothermarchaeota archaeon]|nr:Tfx family DNA-binding protein [Candidatus Hydrothermarchaeota archaeon]